MPKRAGGAAILDSMDGSFHVPKIHPLCSSISVVIGFRNSFPSEKQGRPDNIHNPFILRFPKIASFHLAGANSNL
jgi:hypothetical protein